jgi:hypothetical protein
MISAIILPKRCNKNNNDNNKKKLQKLKRQKNFGGKKKTSLNFFRFGKIRWRRISSQERKE